MSSENKHRSQLQVRAPLSPKRPTTTRYATTTLLNPSISLSPPSPSTSSPNKPTSPYSSMKRSLNSNNATTSLTANAEISVEIPPPDERSLPSSPSTSNSSPSNINNNNNTNNNNKQTVTFQNQITSPTLTTLTSSLTPTSPIISPAIHSSTPSINSTTATNQIQVQVQVQGQGQGQGHQNDASTNHKAMLHKLHFLQSQNTQLLADKVALEERCDDLGKEVRGSALHLEGDDDGKDSSRASSLNLNGENMNVFVDVADSGNDEALPKSEEISNVEYEALKAEFDKQQVKLRSIEDQLQTAHVANARLEEERDELRKDVECGEDMERYSRSNVDEDDGSGSSGSGNGSASDGMISEIKTLRKALSLANNELGNTKVQNESLTAELTNTGNELNTVKQKYILQALSTEPSLLETTLISTKLSLAQTLSSLDRITLRYRTLEKAYVNLKLQYAESKMREDDLLFYNEVEVKKREGVVNEGLKRDGLEGGMRRKEEEMLLSPTIKVKVGNGSGGGNGNGNDGKDGNEGSSSNGASNGNTRKPSSPSTLSKRKPHSPGGSKTKSLPPPPPPQPVVQAHIGEHIRDNVENGLERIVGEVAKFEVSIMKVFKKEKSGGVVAPPPF